MFLPGYSKRVTNSLGNDISFNGVIALDNGWKTKHRNGKNTKKANNDSAPKKQKYLPLRLCIKTSHYIEVDHDEGYANT